MTFEGLKMCDVTLVIILIEKVVPSWKKYRNQLMHKDTNPILGKLVSRVKIKEENHLKNKGAINNPNFSKASKSSNNDNFKSKPRIFSSVL